MPNRQSMRQSVAVDVSLRILGMLLRQACVVRPNRPGDRAQLVPFHKFAGHLQPVGFLGKAGYERFDEGGSKNSPVWMKIGDAAFSHVSAVTGIVGMDEPARVVAAGNHHLVQSRILHPPHELGGPSSFRSQACVKRPRVCSGSLEPVVFPGLPDSWLPGAGRREAFPDLVDDMAAIAPSCSSDRRERADPSMCAPPLGVGPESVRGTVTVPKLRPQPERSWKVQPGWKGLAGSPR